MWFSSHEEAMYVLTGGSRGDGGTEDIGMKPGRLKCQGVKPSQPNTRSGVSSNIFILYMFCFCSFLLVLGTDVRITQCD